MQVIGVHDERYGEEVVAWVIVRDGAAMDSAVRADYCHEKSARYLNVVTEFPMTITGKVRKMVMREESMALLGLAGTDPGTSG